MSYDEMYNGFAFGPYKYDLARVARMRSNVATLHQYQQGLARSYEVKDALISLVEDMGDAVRMPCRVFWRMLSQEESDDRYAVCHECIQKIDRVVQQRLRHIAGEVRG